MATTSALGIGSKKKFILLGILLCLPLYIIPPAFSAGQESVSSPVLTFMDFYEKVLNYYPKLKQQDENVGLAIARKLQAQSGFMPTVQLGGGFSQGDDPVYVFGALLRENNFTSDDFALSRMNTPGAHSSYSLVVSGQMAIFDAMQTISRVKAAKLQIDSAQFEGVFTKMEAFLVACEAYLRAVAIEKLLATTTEVSQASGEDVKQAEDLKDKGLILGADFYTAKVALGNIDQLKNQLQQEKQATHILMNVLMGEDPLSEFVISGNTEKSADEQKTLPEWRDAAFRSRPDLAALEKNIQAQGIDVSREKSTILPRVDAFGEARTDTDSFSSDGGQNYLVGVKATVDLFDPSYSSRIRMSQQTLKKMEYDRNILKDSITRDLANEYARYQATRNNLPVLQSMLDDAKQAVDLTLPLYREGRKSIADLLQIRAAYLNAARGFYSLTTEAKASWSRLLFLSGQMDEANINGVVQMIGE